MPIRIFVDDDPAAQRCLPKYRPILLKPPVYVLSWASVWAAARIHPPPPPPPAAVAASCEHAREKYSGVEGWHTAVSSRERWEEAAEVACSSIVGRGYLGKSRSRKVEQ